MAVKKRKICYYYNYFSREWLNHWKNMLCTSHKKGTSTPPWWLSLQHPQYCSPSYTSVIDIPRAGYFISTTKGEWRYRLRVKHLAIIPLSIVISSLFNVRHLHRQHLELGLVTQLVKLAVTSKGLPHITSWMDNSL